MKGRKEVSEDNSAISSNVCVCSYITDMCAYSISLPSWLVYMHHFFIQAEQKQVKQRQQRPGGYSCTAVLATDTTGLVSVRSLLIIWIYSFL